MLHRKIHCSSRRKRSTTRHFTAAHALPYAPQPNPQPLCPRRPSRDIHGDNAPAGPVPAGDAPRW